MKIEELKINAYGNIKNKDIELKDVNVIYGKNESGKSTLLSYIKNMFYGISKNKNGKEFSEYERYKPWTGEEFSGKMKYKLDNDVEFEIYRDFNKKSPKIFNSNLEDISGQFELDKKDGSQFFYSQTGIDENIFTSTVLAEQQEIKLSEQRQNILIQKIANITGTGDSEISFDKVKDRLNKKQLEEVGTDRTQGRPINIIRSKLESIQSQLNDINKLKDNQSYIEEEKSKLKNKIEENEQRKTVIKEIKNLNDKNMIEQERINYKLEIKKEKQDKIDKLEEQKEEIKSQPVKIKKSIYIIIFVLLVVLNILVYIFSKNNIVKYICYSLLPIYFLVSYILIKKQIKKIKEDEISLIEKQINIIEEEQDEIQKGIEKNELKIKEKQDEIKSKYNVELYEIENSSKELDEISNRISDLKIELNTLEIKEKSTNNEIEKIIGLQEEHDTLKEQLNEIEKKNQEINLTKELLNRAYEKMKRNISPKFVENLSNTMKKITDGKYERININDENGLVVELPNGDYKPANRLSAGTIDQLYMSLRISMIEDLSKEKMPIILDEAFAYYDDERLENILRFLTENYSDHQLILFTSSRREERIFQNINKKFKLITL